MMGLGEAVFDAVTATDAIEGMASEAGCRSLTVPGQIGELDAVVGEHGVDAVRNRFDEGFEEGGGGPHVCLFDEFDDGELGGAIDGHEQVELAFSRSHLGQVDVEEADRIRYPPKLSPHIPSKVPSLVSGQVLRSRRRSVRLSEAVGELWATRPYAKSSPGEQPSLPKIG